MAHFPLLFTFSIIFLLSSTTTPQTIPSVRKEQVPGIMCDECELHYPPPPPPKEKECPPPPLPSPPPPSPPPPSPPPPSPPPPKPVIECPPPPKPVIECPPPPKPKCEGEGVDCLPSLINPYPDSPEGAEYLSPPLTPYPPGMYFLVPPGTIDVEDINGANMMILRFSDRTYFSFFTFLLLICLPYYLFI
ncbi:hypothetical protein VNO78_20702 [Psophocarpus tetragonolobus]|uniref:Leucine-rich repeat extensin-like protein 3 n=1 Tax=Psophocarpus tetragonolobus TaxID=3891 RepID=A0AAN9SBW9_PSOTE